LETDFLFSGKIELIKMRTLDNALDDVLTHYKAVTYEILPESPTQWIVTVYNECAPGSYLKIEVLNLEGTATACVLERYNVGRRSMTRFMNYLMDALDD
jgi:hypothetical protein